MAGSQTPSLAELLLARAFGSRRASWTLLPSHGTLSRRQFIGTTSGVLSAISVVRDPFVPYITSRGRRTTVHYAGRSWAIDGPLFGDNARTGWRRQADGFIVELRDGVLPGTDLDVSFRARLTPRRAGWRIDLTIPSMRFQSAVMLDAWLDGRARLEAPVATRRFCAGESLVSLTGARVLLNVQPSFGFAFGGASTELGSGSNVEIDGPVPSAGSRITLDVREAYEGSLRQALGRGPSPATLCALDAPVAQPLVIPLGRGTGASEVGCCSEGTTAFAGEVFGSVGQREGIWVVEGPLRLHAGIDARASDDPTQLRFEHSALLFTTGACADERMLAGRVRRASYTIETANCQATVAGDDERPFVAHFRDGVSGPIRAQATLEHAWVPLPGAIGASISLPSRPIDIVISHAADVGSGDVGPAHSDADHGKRGRIFLGGTPFVAMPLDASTIVVRRSVDLLNLTFQLDGFDLQVEGGVPYLCRKVPVAPKHPATITVLFEPQHVGEWFANGQNPSACTPDGTSGFPTVGAARLSSRSRIVFKVPPPQLPEKTKGKAARKRRLWIREPLTIESLTDWSDLALLVNARARESTLLPDPRTGEPAPWTFDEQMQQIVGASPNTKAAELLELVAKSLTPPKQTETALTMTGRLVFSPSEAAKFSTPRRKTIDPLAAPLWHARLDDAGRRTVRAIWSQWMTPESFETCPAADPLLTLGPIEHWEIVGQTSVYGLPALRRIEEPGAPGTDAVTTALKTLPRSRVIRPDTAYDALPEIDNLYPLPNGAVDPDTGFAIPQPFTDADIILTSIGGSFVADWRGEPPNLRVGRIAYGPKPAGFSAERFNYWSQLGRDIKVEFVRKGYVLPLGLRCSYVQLTERRFLPHPTEHYPTAYLFKRQFLVFGKPDKHYPGVNQPFESRDFPVGVATMITRRSPDLLDPKAPGLPPPVQFGNALANQHGGVVFPGGTASPPLIFWPRVKPGVPGTLGGDVDFKWTIDGEDSPATSNLLFVENSALASDATVQAIAEHYRTLNGSQAALRTARHAGARRKYAPTTAAGDTSFDTDSWRLSVRGRLLADREREIESFLMDGRMEGADQPPFYPIVEHALVQVQTIDRLVGSPQGLVRVGFNPCYVRDGFGADRTKSEIYLNVLGPDIKLDVTGQGGATGGVAKPNALVAALSRRIGIVGGVRGSGPVEPDVVRPMCELVRDANAVRRPEAAAAAVVAAGGVATAAAAAPQNSPYNFSDAEQNRFEPTQFFGALDAKLLGLIPLKEIISVAAGLGLDAAPTLVEKIGYGPLAADAIDGFKTIVVSQIGTLAGLVQSVVDLLDRSVQDVRVRDLYPELYRVTTGFRDALTAASPRIQNADTIPKLAEVLTGLVASGRALVSEVERLLQDPVPVVIQQSLQDLARAWGFLSKSIDEVYRALVAEFHTQVAAEIETLCRKVDIAGLSDVLFGVRPDVDCAYIVNNPEDAASALADSLFAEVFARPLLTGLTLLRDRAAELNGRLAWARLYVEQRIEHLIQVAVNEMQLAFDGSAAILTPQERRALAHAIVNAVGDLVTGVVTPPPNATFQQVLDELAKVEPQALPRVRMTIDQVIRDHRNALKPRLPTQEARVLDEFLQKVLARAEKVVVDTIRAKVRGAMNDLRARLNQTRADLIATAIDVAQKLAGAVLSSAEFAAIVRTAQRLPGWCEAAAGQVAGALALGAGVADQLMAPADRLSRVVSDLQAATLRLDLPIEVPPRIGDPFAASVNTVKANLQQLADDLILAKATRAEIQQLVADASTQAFSACSDPAKLLKPVGGLLSARQVAVGRIPLIAAEIVSLELGLAAIQTLIASGTLPPGSVASVTAALASARTDVQTIIAGCRELYQGITSIGKAGAAGDWAAVDSRVTDLLTHIGNDPQFAALKPYADAVIAKRDALVAAAGTLRAEIQQAGAQQLKEIEQRVAGYAADLDRQFAALLLQTVALTDSLIVDTIDQGAKAIVAAARLLAPPHRAVAEAFKQVLDVLHAPMVTLIVNQDVVTSFENAERAIDADLSVLAAIVVEGSQTPFDADGVVALALPLIRDWRRTDQPPALVRGLGALAKVIEQILRGDLAAVVDTQLMRRQIAELERQLTEFLQSLVPTSISLDYDWGANLKSLAIFRPLPLHEGGPNHHLTITARIAIDVLRGTRSADVVGTLSPFDITLLKEGPDNIATIHFSGARFASHNGAAPTFSADVSGVEIGTMLQFLEPIQKWLSPANGFYIKLLQDRPGIMAGYAFDAGIISLGALTFVNVALDVRAELPFGNDPVGALFKFSFASMERPFLISAPPYGGGGHVALEANAKGIVGMSMSLMFGAVVAIKFGPLSAQGRLTAGIYIRQSKDSRQVGALIEAVGEGQIACFGISVCLQVGLVDEDGTLRGFSNYTFEFKVGFFTISFSIRASYTVRSQQSSGPPVPSGSPVAGLAASSVVNAACLPPGPDTRTYRSLTPRKGLEWSAYRKHIAMELIDVS